MDIWVLVVIGSPVAGIITTAGVYALYRFWIWLSSDEESE